MFDRSLRVSDYPSVLLWLTVPNLSSDRSDPVDLDQLRDLSFAPQWSTGSPVALVPARKNRGTPVRRVPRGIVVRPAPARAVRVAGKIRARARPGPPEPFKPVVDFSIFPEDEPFDLLVQSMRSTLKVYELFEVTRLILDKPDRMVVVVSPLSEEAPPLYESLPDRQIFRGEAAALRHAASILLSAMFEEKEEEVEAPTGKFPAVMRCGVTGKLLPPKSYHRFQALLQEHHRTNCPEVPLSRVEKESGVGFRAGGRRRVAVLDEQTPGLPSTFGRRGGGGNAGTGRCSIPARKRSTT